MQHRADIDGLRGLAVLAVVACHAGVPGLAGGFLGVDVFFVISGYLIAGVIAERQAAGDFSLAGFWERRIRRILPALLVVALATMALAWGPLLPRDLESVARSALAALFSVSNLWFWRDSGYFTGSDTLRPLLHTWSLGVEEQFYLAFPLFMLAAARLFPDRRRLVLALIAAASLATAAWCATSHVEAGFYLPVTRAWELLAGVLLALAPPLRLAPPARHAAGLAGLALILGSVALLSGETPWLGVATLAPCLGAALLIASGQQGIAGRMLAWPPLVGIGLISYSLYLWHWPLLTLQRLTALGGHGGVATAGVIALALVLAVLTWRLVERPCRDRRFLTRRQLFAAAAVCVGLTAAPALVILAADGFPHRFDARALALEKRLGKPPYGPYRSGTCFLSSGYDSDDFRPDLCLARDPGRPDWLLIGDSHAAHLLPGLMAVNADINILQANATGCRLTRGSRGSNRAACRDLASLLYERVLPTTPPDGLILAARWGEDSLPDLAATLDWARARGLRVVLIGPAVRYDEALPRLLALSRRLDDPGLPARRRLKGPRDLDRRMAELARSKGVAYVSLFETLCRGEACVTEVSPGVPLSFDEAHLTPEGSRLVASRLRASGAFPPRP